MSRFYIVLLGISSLMLAATGAWFSVYGLSQLFAGASKQAMLMAGVLEFSKLVAAGFLYRYWGHINKGLRTYLCIAVTTLVAITSLGIFGFLSNAYQKSSFALKTQNTKMQVMIEEDQRLQKQIDDINAFITAIPANRVSRKFEFQKFYDPQVREIKKQSAALHKKMAELKLAGLDTQAELGPIVYTAEALGMEVDTVAKYLILFFVLVFDPLAVCLMFCWNLVIRLKEKYRGDESKISARALMTDPVDHRLKKVA